MKKSLKQIAAWILAFTVMFTMQACSVEREEVMATVSQQETVIVDIGETLTTEATEVTKATQSENPTQETEAEEESATTEQTEPAATEEAQPEDPTQETEENQQNNTTGEEVCVHNWVYTTVSDEYGDKQESRYCPKCNEYEELGVATCEHEWEKYVEFYVDIIVEITYCVQCEEWYESAVYPNNCIHDWEYTTETGYDWVEIKGLCTECGAVTCENKDNTCTHDWTVEYEYDGSTIVDAHKICTLCGAEIYGYNDQDYCNHVWEPCEEYEFGGLLLIKGEYCVICNLYVEKERICSHRWETVQIKEGDVVLSEYKYCNICKVEEVIYDNTESCVHQWEQYTDGGENGVFYSVRRCNICGKEEILEAIQCSHVWEYEYQYCGSSVLYEYINCTECLVGEVIHHPEVHQWVEEYVYDENGEVAYVTRTCSNCGEWGRVG